MAQDRGKAGKRARRKAGANKSRRASGPASLSAKTDRWKRKLLVPQAPDVRWLRELYASDECVALDSRTNDLMYADLPSLEYDRLGIAPDDAVEAAQAWPILSDLHTELIRTAESYAGRRGSAEWLFWLRRLRGQFHANSLATTDPYVQALVEALAAGAATPSNPMNDVPTFVFGIDEQLIPDLLWMRNAALLMYRLHGTMKRCAKGQAVQFLRGDIPYAIPDELVESAIDDFDRRGIKAGASVLDAVGLHGERTGSPRGDDSTFGGYVPTWMHLHTARPHGVLDVDGPPPAIPTFLDLGSVNAFAKSHILTEEHVALIVLLWATTNIMSREPERAKARTTAALQWGYSVTPTENWLHLAIEESLLWLRGAPSPVIPPGSIPATPERLIDVLNAIQPSVFPPLCGSPLHEAGRYTLIDLTGASHRLVETMVRPNDGAAANIWSAQFETDVQEIIDASPWRPDGELRGLIGRTVVRPLSKNRLTDIDAVAALGNKLILLSCKSMAYTTSASRGDHATIRNLREKAERAAQDWGQVVEIIRASPEILRVELADDTEVFGLVVTPAIPFVVEPRWREAVAPLDTPTVISTMELATALRAPLRRRPR